MLHSKGQQGGKEEAMQAHREYVEESDTDILKFAWESR